MLKRYTPVLSQMGFSAIQVAGRLAHVGLIENDWQAELPGQKEKVTYSHILWFGEHGDVVSAYELATKKSRPYLPLRVNLGCAEECFVQSSNSPIVDTIMHHWTEINLVTLQKLFETTVIKA